MVKKILQLLTEHDSEHDLEKVQLMKKYKELKKRKAFSVPKIFHGGDKYDLKKRWYVYYSFRNPETGKLERQDNIYFNVNRDYHTKKDRLNRLKVIQKELEWFLENGYSPYTNNQQKDYRTASLLDFALEIKKQSLKPTSYKDYENRLGHFKRYLEKKNLLDAPIHELNKKVVMDFLNELLKNSSARNRNNTRSVLSALFGVLEDNEHIPRNFIANIKKLKADPHRNKTYTAETVEEIFTYLEKNKPNLHFFVKLMSFCFLRPIEVCRLKVGDINFQEQLLYVRAKNKAVKVKIIPDILMPELEHLKQLPKGYYICSPSGAAPWDTEEINKRDYFSKQYKEVKDALALEKDQTLYSFRHTYITKVYREFRTKYNLSESQDKLMLITGHSSIQALRNYLRDIDAELPADYSEHLK